MSTQTALVTAASAFVAMRAYYFMSYLKSVAYLPGIRPPFSPLSLFGAVIPTYWWNPGLSWTWQWRKSAYFGHSHDIISMVPFLLGTPSYYTCSLDVMQQLLASENKTQLVKPRELTSVLLLWGDNLVSANGEMWKRHRRILGPAFTHSTYNLVIKETISTYEEMIVAEGWADKNELFVSNFNRIPLRVALMVISRCGFRLPMAWNEQSQGGSMSFGEALERVSRTNIARLVIPNWAYKMPIKTLHDIKEAWESLAVFMHEIVQSRREEIDKDSEGALQYGDLFTRLVEAYEGEGLKYGLEEQEVIGNIFTFMFAGHETTAYALTATLGFLAIHQDEQEQAYREIVNAIPDGRDPTLEDLPKLRHTLACFYESLRIYPAGYMLTRDMPEDVIVRVKNPVETTVVLQAGSRVILDMIGIHHNPHAFPDPEKFKPSRWNNISEHDVSVFGLGPRACIGRKFSQTEALTFLALFLRDWKLDIILAPGETRALYEERVMGSASRIGLVLGVGEISFNLTRRS